MEVSSANELLDYKASVEKKLCFLVTDMHICYSAVALVLGIFTFKC